MTHTEATDEQVPIGVAARELGVSVETLRRWSREGLISSTRTLGNQRRFSLAEIRRIKGDAA